MREEVLRSYEVNAMRSASTCSSVNSEKAHRIPFAWSRSLLLTPPLTSFHHSASSSLCNPIFLASEIQLGKRGSEINRRGREVRRACRGEGKDGEVIEEKTVGGRHESSEHSQSLRDLYVEKEDGSSRAARAGEGDSLSLPSRSEPPPCHLPRRS